MQFLNLPITVFHSPDYVGEDPVNRATWITLLAHCCELENGGRICRCQDWGDRRWQQTFKVTLEEVQKPSALLRWELPDLIVCHYPSAKEGEIQAKRRAGLQQAAARWGSKKLTPTRPDSSAISSADSSATSSPDAEGKVREGKVREGERDARADETEAQSVEAEIPTPEEVVTAGDMVGVPPDFCRHYHAQQEIRNRWLAGPPGREKVRGWRAELKQWWERDKATWGKNGAPGASTATGPVALAMTLERKLKAAEEERKQMLDRHTFPNPDGSKGWGSTATPEVRAKIAELGATIKDCRRRLSEIEI